MCQPPTPIRRLNAKLSNNRDMQDLRNGLLGMCFTTAIRIQPGVPRYRSARCTLQELSRIMCAISHFENLVEASEKLL